MDFAITPWAADFQHQIQRAGVPESPLPAALRVGHRQPERPHMMRPYSSFNMYTGGSDLGLMYLQVPSRNTWAGFKYEPLKETPEPMITTPAASAQSQGRIANRRASAVPLTAPTATEPAAPPIALQVGRPRPKSSIPHTGPAHPSVADGRGATATTAVPPVEQPQLSSFVPPTAIAHDPTTSSHLSIAPSAAGEAERLPSALQRHSGSPITHATTSPGMTTTRVSDLIFAITNASKAMSLRKWLQWIVNLREIHVHQSVDHVQPMDLDSPAAPAIRVLRNLQEMLLMYKPGRVKLSCAGTRDCVSKIHEIMSQQKLEMEERFEELERNSRTSSPNKFLEFLSFKYQIAGQRLDLPKPGILYKPDKLDHQVRQVEKAMSWYSFENTNILFDNTATNTFADVIVNLLKRLHRELKPEHDLSHVEMPKTRVKWLQKEIHSYQLTAEHKRLEKEHIKARAERPLQAVGASVTGTVTTAPRTPDRLLFHHAAPSPRYAHYLR